MSGQTYEFIELVLDRNGGAEKFSSFDDFHFKIICCGQVNQRRASWDATSESVKARKEHMRSVLEPKYWPKAAVDG
jgi:hypothetical protein